MLKKFILSVLICLPFTPLFSQISVEITPIELNDGMAQIEMLINSETGDTAEVISGIISTYLEKPLLFEAMNESQILTASILPMLRPQARRYSIAAGSSAAFTGPAEIISSLPEQIKTLDVESDIFLGASLQGFSAGLSFPADFLLPELYLTAGAGFHSFAYENISLAGASAHISAAYRFFTGRKVSILEWNGISVETGASWSANSLSVFYVVDISQTFSLDPDGAGPLLAFDVTINLDPEAEISYSSNQFTFPLFLSTGADISKLLNISGGIGAVLALGSNSINIEANDEIEIMGYLQNLVQAPPEVVVSGNHSGAAAPLLTPFMGGCLSLELGRLTLNIPVSWDFKNTLTAGFSVGAGF